MPATPDHKAAIHELVTQRKAAGLPVWEHKIRLGGVFHNDAMTFEQSRDAVVARIRASAWFKSKDDYDNLPQFVEELADTQNTDEFDSVWDAIYDEADHARVWIDLHGLL